MDRRNPSISVSFTFPHWECEGFGKLTSYLCFWLPQDFYASNKNVQTLWEWYVDIVTGKMNQLSVRSAMLTLSILLTESEEAVNVPQTLVMILHMVAYRYGSFHVKPVTS